MTCPSCGAQNPAGKRFCSNCGVALPSATAGAPNPGSTSSVPPAGQGAPIAIQKRGRGCLGWGCLIILSFLAIILVVGGVYAGLYFQVPERLGLVQSPAERLLSGPPNREAATAIKADVAKQGINTTGMDLYVLPIAGTDGSLVVATLDASKGFQFKSANGSEPILDYMTRLTTSGPAKTAKVQRVVIDYRDKTGSTLMTMTAPTEAISGYAQGTLTRKEFMKQIDGTANWPALYQQAFQ